MATSLPLKIKVGVRDAWDNPNSEAQKAMNSLRAVLGSDVTIHPQWQLLWTALQPKYPEMSNFVPSVGVAVVAWCKSMEMLLGDEERNQAWIEKMLDECLQGQNGLRVRLEVGKGERPATNWLAGQKSFVLSLPYSQPPSVGSAIAVFNDDLLECFNPKPKPTVSIPTHTTSNSAAATTDDWSDVKIDDNTGLAAAFDKPPATAIHTTSYKRVEYLPSISTLPRPEDLMLKPPYHLTINRIFDLNDGFEVQCSHSPSLNLLADYLKKWVRQNHGDTRHPPQVTVTLCESAFGLGVLHDRLVLVPSARHFKACAPLLLAFVEQVLGFTLVRAGDANWWYRREAEFRTL